MTDAFRDLLARPEPSDLTQIALQMLGTIESMELIIPEITDTIRKALEQGNPTPQLAQPEGEELTDEALLELMPHQFRDDLATVSRAAAHVAGPGVTPGIFRVSLNTGALSYARAAIAADRARRQHPQPVPVAIPGEEYHEDMGPVTWWRLPVEEPPWVGTPNDSDWPGYHTHFTPAPPTPCNANALPLPTSEEATNAS